MRTKRRLAWIPVCLISVAGCRSAELGVAHKAVTPAEARELVLGYGSGSTGISADHVADALVSVAYVTDPGWVLDQSMVRETCEAQPGKGRALCIEICRSLMREFKTQRFSLVPDQREETARHNLNSLWFWVAARLLEEGTEGEFAAKMVLQAAARRYSALWLSAMHLMSMYPNEGFAGQLVCEYGNFYVCHEAYHWAYVKALAINGGADGARMVASYARESADDGRASLLVGHLAYVADPEGLRELTAFLGDERPLVRNAAKAAVGRVTGQELTLDTEDLDECRAASARLQERFFGPGVRLKVTSKKDTMNIPVPRFEIAR